MTIYLFRSADREGTNTGHVLDPIVEGARYGLGASTALALWADVCGTCASSDPRRDAQAQEQFHRAASQSMARGGPRQSEVGRMTRVDLELNGARLGAHNDGRRPGVPGRETLVSAEARRQAAEMSASALHAGPSHMMLRSEHADSAASVVDPEHPAVQEALRSRGQGVPLQAALRHEMEIRLGVDLRRVNVHVDDVAEQATQAVAAKAFTVGEDIFFARGQFAPTSQTGLELLAHELVHVVQGWQGRVPVSATGSVQVSHPDDALEREAETAGRGVMCMAPAVLTDVTASPSSGMLQRAPEDGTRLISRYRSQGIQDARNGEPLAVFEKNILSAHWPSAAARRAYARGFLTETHRMATGSQPDPDELDLQLASYEKRLRDIAQQAEAEAPARARANDESRRKQLLQEVLGELTIQRTQRLIGTDPRMYPWARRSHRSFGRGGSIQVVRGPLTKQSASHERVASRFRTTSSSAS